MSQRQEIMSAEIIKIKPPQRSRRACDNNIRFETTRPARDSSLLKQGHTEQRTTPKTAKRSKKKGPDFPQIFPGQTFIFVPNNNSAVPRKRRIDKAARHGAI
jgi:hypothetical protein